MLENAGKPHKTHLEIWYQDCKAPTQAHFKDETTWPNRPAASVLLVTSFFLLRILYQGFAGRNEAAIKRLPSLCAAWTAPTRTKQWQASKKTAWTFPHVPSTCRDVLESLAREETWKKCDHPFVSSVENHFPGSPSATRCEPAASASRSLSCFSSRDSSNFQCSKACCEGTELRKWGATSWDAKLQRTGLAWSISESVMRFDHRFHSAIPSTPKYSANKHVEVSWNGRYL